MHTCYWHDNKLISFDIYPLTMITLQNGIHWSHFWCQDIVLNIKTKGIAEAVITKYRGFVNKHQRIFMASFMI